MERYREPNRRDAYEMAIAGRLAEYMEEKMGEEKAVKPKQTGMALEMDVIKKTTHQLERAPRGAEMRILAFVQDWAGRRALVPMSPAPNGQLPLAAKDDGFPE